MNVTELPFKVEAWTKNGQVNRLLATASNVDIAMAAYDAAIWLYSKERITLRQGHSGELTNCWAWVTEACRERGKRLRSADDNTGRRLGALRSAKGLGCSLIPGQGSTSAHPGQRRKCRLLP